MGGKMKEKSRVMLELVLVFDNDYDVYQISNKLGITCDKCKNKSETRINPLTNQQNPGYWELKTGYITSDNFKTIEDLLFDRIRSKIDKIKEVLSKGNGEALFWIVPTVRNKEFPDVSISREFIQIAAQLNARIDFDVYL